MNTHEIAARLVALCRTGQFEAAQRELYSPDAVSIEPAGPSEQREAHGLEALAAKGRRFADTFETHGCEVSEPLVAGNFFACILTADVTERKSGARFPLSELCVYEVRSGRIVREQFFFTSPG